jgi:UDP-galactopyranose mutase
VRFTYDNYFKDKYQEFGRGYNKLIEGLLEGIKTITDVGWLDKQGWDDKAEKVVIYW